MPLQSQRFIEKVTATMHNGDGWTIIIQVLFVCNSEWMCLWYGKGVMKRKLYFPFGWTKSRLTISLKLKKFQYNWESAAVTTKNRISRSRTEYCASCIVCSRFEMNFFFFLVAIGHIIRGDGGSTGARFAWYMIIFDMEYITFAVPTLYTIHTIQLYISQYVNIIK